MRRSTHVVAPILASAAVALLTGCHHSPEMQRCVDANNRVVDPALCKAGTSAGGHGGGAGVVPYRYYYGGRGTYAPGSAVEGGSFAPAGGHSYSTTNGTVRGGFGESFGGGHGGGGGEGGGGGGE